MERSVGEAAKVIANEHLAHIGGARGCAGMVLAKQLHDLTRAPIVYVANDSEAAKRATDDARFFFGRSSVLSLLQSETSPYADINPDRRASMARLGALFALSSGRPFDILVVNAPALVRLFVPKTALETYGLRIEAEGECDREEFAAKLANAGYLRVPVVEDPGTFAVRGSLVDVWPPDAEAPLRIELYDDLVASIKPFDPFEQRTSKEVSLSVAFFPPAREAISAPPLLARARTELLRMAEALDLPTRHSRALIEDVVSGRAFFGAEGFLPAYYEKLDPLFRYLPTNARIFLDDPTAIALSIRAEIERATSDQSTKERSLHFPSSSFFSNEEEVVAGLAQHNVAALHPLEIIGGGSGGLGIYTSPSNTLRVAAEDHAELQRDVKLALASKGKTSTLAPLVQRIKAWREDGYRVVLSARTQVQCDRLTTLLSHQGIHCSPPIDTLSLSRESLSADVDASFALGSLTRGALFPLDRLAVVTEEELFGGRSHRQKRRATPDPTRTFAEDLRSLTVGDFVVHAEHGIGKYQGLVHKDVGGHTVDLIVVEYAANDRLYLPVYRLNQIQKYSGGENASPKVDRLGGSTFAKTKAKVKKAVRQMADELLRLYAERQAVPGDALPPPDDDYRAFEATFPFDETPDQSRAIDDVNHDLEQAKPMDRLVCGDVGFGKTEVAIRAAFRVAMAGKQVAILCPTTVLAQQHFRVFESRLQNYPIRIAALSRFQTQKEQDETATRLKEGKVDVVVGTHRLLSKDVHFKSLGLLVVDEEQRFGVGHKERIKQMKTSVDVLTLSATPIPRTLQMAVGGLRDLSLIATAPSDRRAVRTIVSRYDERVLKDAVERELARGGQIFYVYNRVDGIYERAQNLERLVPNARICVGHGQMGAKGATGKDGSSALEKVMLDFVEGKYDILVATSIIESGLDIPRANTIIIDRADLFGLAQLYQIRGRVGRSKERAYCYLMVPEADSLSDEARMRIDALERHTELGSGFKIASLDLELRGAGDVLGGEQSGNVASVGFDLFCQMLSDAVHEIRGEEAVHDVDPDLSFDADALLPEHYVADVGVRLSFYKKLASAIDEAHVAELAMELEERFGPPPTEARRFIKLMSLKTELRKLRALGCEATSKSVTLHLREDTPLDAEKIMDLVRKPKSLYRLTPDMRLTRRFEPSAGDGIANTEMLLAELAKCWKAG